MLGRKQLIFVVAILLVHLAASLPHRDNRVKRQLHPIQTKLVQLLNPKPIVDTIQEKDKYGNMVDHVIGKKVVSAFESISKVVSSALTIPMESVKAVSRGATEFLNQIGAKIVGLQK